MRFESFLETIDRNLECKTTYATEVENPIRGTGSTHIWSEDVACRQAFEHINELYKNNFYTHKGITIRGVKITKYFPPLPFIRATVKIPGKISPELFSSILRKAGNVANQDT